MTAWAQSMAAGRPRNSVWARLAVVMSLANLAILSGLAVLSRFGL